MCLKSCLERESETWLMAKLELVLSTVKKKGKKRECFLVGVTV